jgi:hypothetical protein
MGPEKYQHTWSQLLQSRKSGRWTESVDDLLRSRTDCKGKCLSRVWLITTHTHEGRTALRRGGIFFPSRPFLVHLSDTCISFNGSTCAIPRWRTGKLAGNVGNTVQVTGAGELPVQHGLQLKPAVTTTVRAPPRPGWNRLSNVMYPTTATSKCKVDSKQRHCEAMRGWWRK